MRKAAAIIVCVSAVVMFSNAAEARRLSFSFGRSVSKPVVPMSKPVAAPNASAAQGRSSTFIMVGTSQRPMAAAPQTSVPERGSPHDPSFAADQFAAASEKPVEQKLAEPVAVVEQQPEPPVMQTTPVFVSMASPPKPAERTMASAQPGRTVYCAVQAKGGCAPF